MKKVKKFPLAEFLELIISAKKCVILDISNAMKRAKIVEYFQNFTLETSFISTGHLAFSFHRNEWGMNMKIYIKT